MKDLKVDFIVHWLWAFVFGLMLITGLTLMGAKFGWVMNNYVALADYLHRTLAAFFVILAFIMVVLEAIRLSKPKPKKMPWLVINKSSLGIFVLAATLLFTLSGVFLWICKDFSHNVLAFALVTHELLTFISGAVIIWHIYDKAYAIPADFEVVKSAK